MSRKEKALKILKRFRHGDYHYLGEGLASTVFHDHKRVYKLYLPQSDSYGEIKKGSLALLKDKIPYFKGATHLFELTALEEIEGHSLLIYPYEESSPIKNTNEEEMIGFLTECWQRKLIFRDIKRENFRRVKNRVVFIDYELDSYNDNLFLNMAARSFIMVKYHDRERAFIKKLNRSTINQFDLPELEGLQQFCNRLFANIVYRESLRGDALSLLKTPPSVKQNVVDEVLILPYSTEINLRKLFYQLIADGHYLKSVTPLNIEPDHNNYLSPKELKLDLKRLNRPEQKVSLIIKACPQDSATLYSQVLHIIKQLSSPDIFCERVVAIDKKQNNFLREYTSKGSLKELYRVIEQLIEEQIIDRFIELPEKESLNVNRRWFNLEVSETHNIANIPVTPQLYAFEKAAGDYILQMDSDVMIGRYDYEHSFLSDMLAELEKSPQVISVGFNICHSPEAPFKSYYGFENGGFVPEVRCGLFDKRRLLQMRPLPNSIVDGRLKLSWYRSLEQKQKESGLCSIRGGAPASFYIHPQNYRKESAQSWLTILDRVESNAIPVCQYGEFDLKGSYYEWTIAKRREPMIIVTLVRDIEYGRFLRMWLSLISQTYRDWGLIIIDDNSGNGLELFIEQLVKEFSSKVTFIKNRAREGAAANLYKAIHYFTGNEDSVIVTLDGDDALIGNRVLESIMDRYIHENGDMLVGKMYRTDKLSAHYKYRPNFISPRKYGGNVWQHLRSFKKKLFDSLSIFDLKLENKIKGAEEHSLLSRLSQTWSWVKACSDYAMMVPICEMSSNPLIEDNFNYLHDRTTPSTSELRVLKDSIIENILSKKAKTAEDIIEGRKEFIPNLNLIEIDITYRCNLNCHNCNRSCTQAPTEEELSFEQIKQFVKESIELKKRWKVISILGGEPTLHKDFHEIVYYIVDNYIVPHSKETVLKIVSNGWSRESREALERLKGVQNITIDRASFKSSKKVEYFSPFNKAPIDQPAGDEQEFGKGCWVTSYCGIGLNHLGYYACGVSGGIDRVFGMNRGIKSLHHVDESIKEQLDTFCQYCGNFTDYAPNKGDFIPRAEKDSTTRSVISETWREQYRRYNSRQRRDKIRST